ncbi:MAG: TauD/TfdA family dioxygenase, partial [Burkholderiaceae bacterium]
MIEIKPCTGVGAEVLGVDLNTLGDEEFHLIRQAYADYGVIFFRDQEITPQAHISFARRWNPIAVNQFFDSVENFPEIAEVRKEAENRDNIGGGWHTDHSYDAEPAMGSILVARELPDSGGETLFANMYSAFESLSPGLQQCLRGLNAVHSSGHVFGPQGSSAQRTNGGRSRNPELATQVSTHPVVIRHPLSGREALYVNGAFTLHFEGWTVAESEPLLQLLYTHASRPEFTCRFEWRPGSVAFWDNRATWHYA